MCIEASKWEEAKCLQQIPNKYTLSLLCRRDQTGTFESSFPTKNCTHARKKRDQTRPTKAKDIFRLCIAHSVGNSTQQSHITTFARASLVYVKIEMRLFYVDYKPLWFSGCKEKKRPWEARALVVKYANVKLS